MSAKKTEQGRVCYNHEMSCAYDIPVVTIMSAEALVSPLLYAEAYALMPEARIRKTDRYRQEKDRRHSVAAGLLLRKTVLDAGIDPGILEHLEEGEQGKPFCAGLPFRFNLSHSGDFAVCAAAREAIGIDIEVSRVLSEAVKKRVFTESERRLMRSGGFRDTGKGLLFPKETGDGQDEREASAGICLWTVKESYLKMKGAGITVDPILVETEPADCGNTGKSGSEYQYFNIVCRKWPDEVSHAVTVWHEGIPVSVCTESPLGVPEVRLLSPEACMARSQGEAG